MKKKYFLVFVVILNLASTNIIYAADYGDKVKSDNYAMILVDADTGKIIKQECADDLRFPASLTKMMTMYTVFDEMRRGKIRLNALIPVSEKAASQIPSKLGLSAGERVPLSTLIESLAIVSANDSAVAIAEAVSGSEEKFVSLMNKKAIELGMKNTSFKNANGLHEDRQTTTARDMAKLVHALRVRFPEHYYIFSRTSMTYKNRKFKSHNSLLEDISDDLLVTGVKTGFTNAAGYNLASAATKNQKNIIAILMGEPSITDRNINMFQLIQEGFDSLGSSSQKMPEIRHFASSPMRARKIMNMQYKIQNNKTQKNN